MSDHLRGRGLGRPSGQSAWSLHATVLRLTLSPTALRLSGGTDRRPMRVLQPTALVEVGAAQGATSRPAIDRDWCWARRTRGGNTSRVALFPHRVPPPVPLGQTAERGTPSACSSNCESSSRSQWRSLQRSGRRFNAGGRLGPCNLAANNSCDKWGVSTPRTGSGTASWQDRGLLTPRIHCRR